ncbi:MAG: thioredoxin family protein [Cellulophaga sp.]
MKKVLLLFLLPLFLTAQNKSSTENNWLTNYEEALKIAKKEKKNIVMYFTGSDWCPPCKMLKKELFSTQEFKTLAKNYVLLYVDVPRNARLLTPELMVHNKALLKKWNKKGVFPLFKILNNKEILVDELSGYTMNGKIQFHLNLLKKHQ